jgi:hypothetical protein
MASDTSTTAGTTARSHLRAFGGSLAVVALVIVVATVFVSLGVPLIEAVGVPRGSALGRALTSAFQFVGFGVAVAGFLAVTDNWGLVDVARPGREDAKWVGVGLSVLFGLYLGTTFLLQSLGIQGADSTIVAQGQEQPVYFLYLVPVTVLLVGPTEELVFRGVVQGLFRVEYGPRVAVAASSLIFSVIHWSSFSGSGRFATLGVIVVLGATLGLLYEKTRNLVVPAAVHGLFNAVQFVAVYASVTGLV